MQTRVLVLVLVLVLVPAPGMRHLGPQGSESQEVGFGAAVMGLATWRSAGPLTKSLSSASCGISGAKEADAYGSRTFGVASCCVFVHRGPTCWLASFAPYPKGSVLCVTACWGVSWSFLSDHFSCWGAPVNWDTSEGAGQRF